MVSGEMDTPPLRQAQGDGYRVLHKPANPQNRHDLLNRRLKMDPKAP
jgi:hypothetical protein